MATSSGDLVSSFKAASQTISYLVQTLQRMGPGAWGNVGSSTNTTVSPNAYAYTLGTASISTLTSNQARIGVLFHNPSSTAIVSVCPSLSATGGSLAAVLGGAGSYTILPQSELRLMGIRSTCSWNGIANTTAPLTVWEFV